MNSTASFISKNLSALKRSKMCDNELPKELEKAETYASVDC